MSSAAASSVVGPLGAYLLVVVLAVPAVVVAHVRGGRSPAVMALAGTAALLGATAVVAGERPWAVPLSLAVVSLLLVLASLRQIASSGEAAEAPPDDRRLLADLLDRSLQDRRRFARHLHEQAMAAYASFATLAGACRSPAGMQRIAAEATVLVGDELGRQAELLRDLVRAIRPTGGDRNARPGLGPPIAAYHASVHGEATSPAPAPRLTLAVDDALALDWVAETVLLHVAQEALHNVHRHSGASSVEVTVKADRSGGGGAGEAVRLEVADDGAGFDPGTTGEGPGIAAMRAAAAAVGGTVTVESRPGLGTTVSARLGGRPPSPALRSDPPTDVAFLRPRHPVP
jgi:signal transduction histidine kinase